MSARPFPISCNPASTRPLIRGVLRWNVWKCKLLASAIFSRYVFFKTGNYTLFVYDDSKDVRLPVQLQRAMAAEAEAAREARAKVIAAEGEQKASHALKEAASVIQESPSALQVIFALIFSMHSTLPNKRTGAIIEF